jgi:hypothetical protein
MTTTTETKKRTITLTGRRPVTISDADWPGIAGASGDSGSTADYMRYEQRLRSGELDKYWIRVRQHADGRVLVYAAFDAAHAWTGNSDCRGGELLSAGADIAAAIGRVGEECGIPDRVIRECIASLPAEEL